MRIFAALVAVLLSFAGLWVSTQYVATQLRYAPQLGSPWAIVGGQPLYPPWAWMVWDQAYGRTYPAPFRKAEALSAGAAVLGLLCSSAARRRRRGEPSTAHGSSRWMETAELHHAGLIRDEGVVLCQTSEAEFTRSVNMTGETLVRRRRLGFLVRHDGPEHVFCFAPTRSGKGVGLVVPTLLSWPHSVLVYDIKKENWSLTAGWRRRFSRVWRFEPTALDSVRFNPLQEIRRGSCEVRDTQNIADILVDPSGEHEARDHWQTTAHSLLCGAILHVLYAEQDKTLAGVAAFLSDPSRTEFETLERMRTTLHLTTEPHLVVAQVAREMLNKSDNELSGVFSTAMACLGLYRDPVIARNTSTSDFCIGDLMNADAPVSLYLVVPPSDLSRTRPVIRLLLNQIGRRLTESMGTGTNSTYKHRLLLLLDEFPSLGRLDFFETALAFIAGYGLKAVLIAQSLNQLEKAYGANNSILDNCHVRVTYGANDDRTAKRISDLLGQATEKKMQKSYSGSGLFLTNRSESEHEYPRPLLTAAEVTQLPPDDAILMIGGHLPYRGRKVRYFVDSRMKERAGLPPPDDEQAQARELLPQRPSDWEGLSVTHPTAPGAHAGAGVPSKQPDVAAIWGDYLPQKKSRDDGENETEGNLPL